MENLLKNFDKIFLINLDSRKDRLDECMSILDKYNLGDLLVRFSAITPPKEILKTKDSKGRTIHKGAVGLVLSVVEIIKEAKEKKYKSILVLEDDFLFNNEEHSNDVLKQLNTLNWDVFYLGANLHKELDQVSDNIFKIKGGYTTHAIAYNENFYDYFLENYNNNVIEIIDVWLSKFAQEELNCYCSWPILSTQRPSYSDIEGRFADYDWMSKNYHKFTKQL